MDRSDRVAVLCRINEKKLINDFEEGAGTWNIIGLKNIGKFIRKIRE